MSEVHKRIFMMKKIYTYPLLRRSLDELRAVCDWASARSDDPYALGVMAALSYAFCKCKATPAEVMNDTDSIIKSASHVGWATTWEECFWEDFDATCGADCECKQALSE